MYFDSHAHLDDGRFQEDFDDILARMKENGVTAMMNIGCDLPSSENSVRLAQTYDWVWAAVGSHPDDADHVDAARIEVYRALCKSPRVQAIGEIGLDYHYEDVPREVQKHAFRLQMQLARECSLPVVVHEREAHEDGLKIIDEFPDVTGVFHCFSGSLEMAKELVKRGWYIGFTGVVTFKNARKAVEVASSHSARADSDRDRLPVYGAGAVSRAAQRSVAGSLRRGKDRCASGAFLGAGRSGNERKCQTPVPDFRGMS